MLGLMRSALSFVVFLTMSPAQKEFEWPPVAAEDRAVLMELYEATHGEGWYENEGWGGNGSVCEWARVGCYPHFAEGFSAITSLDLFENNLVGEIPSSIAQLDELQYLSLFENDLSGVLPEALLQRFDRNELRLQLSRNSFSNLITSLRIEYSATGILCCPNSDCIYTADIEDWGPARFESVRCTEGTERGTHCLEKVGQGAGMTRLTRGLEHLGFRDFEPEYTFGGPTHAAFFRTMAWYGDGTKKEVETYAGLGPIEVWAAQQLFLAALADVEWESETTTAKCSFLKEIPK